jgi:hypothetical protein
MAVQPQADDVQAILKAPLPSDARLLMLSVSILGRGWPRLENEQWIKKAEKRLQHILNSYESYPFNIRYKIIDALALEPIWRPKVKHASEQEAHLYVHWYKASLGL